MNRWWKLAFCFVVLPGCGDGSDGATLDNPDSAAPSVTLTGITDDISLSGIVPLSASGTDDVGIVNVTFFIDDASIGVATASPFEILWDTTVYVDGNYTLKVDAMDAAGNIGEVSARINVQNGSLSPEAIHIVNPVDGATICGLFTVEAAISVPASGIVFSLDGEDQATDPVSPYTWTWNTSQASNSLHQLRATATTDQGIIQNTVTVAVANSGQACDNLPSLILTSPVDASFINENIVLEAEASDDIGVTRVQFFIDNALLAEDISTPFSVEWEIDPFADGPHTVKAIAYDTALQTTVVQATTTIDRVPPEVEIITPEAGAVFGDEVVDISADVTDALGLDIVSVNVNGNEIATFSEGPYVYEWNTRDEPSGQVNLSVFAYDKTGAYNYDNVIVNLDRPPQVEITAPEDGALLTGAQVIAANASDDFAVSAVEFRVDGLVMNTDTAASYAWEWNTCASTGGEHTIEVVASDEHSAESSDSVAVIIDPQQYLDADADGYTPCDGDCDDSRFFIYSGAVEDLDDSLDDDCDGMIDEPEVTALAAGTAHSLALENDGTVWAWGWNRYGQVGDGTTTDRTTPVRVSDLSGVVAIAAGGNASLALRSDGTVWAWGENQQGQLGNGTTTTNSTPLPGQVLDLDDVVAVAGGDSFFLARKRDGTVWGWGFNGYCELGDGTTNSRSTPAMISSLSGVAAIGAGGLHSLALKTDGTLWAWGDNTYGQLGDGSDIMRCTPIQVSMLSEVTAIEGGYYHSLAVTTDGTVWSWGYNYHGELGDGSNVNRSTPVQVLNLAGVSAIAGGGYWSLALESDGIVWSWGYNALGQLGDGTGADQWSPVKVSSLSGITRVAAGGDQSLALRQDDTVWGWGDDQYGELGDGVSGYHVWSYTPVQTQGFY